MSALAPAVPLAPAAPAAPAARPAALPGAGAVGGAPRLLLRLEGALLLALAVLAYRELGGGWELFAALFLVPDLALLGYLAGPRVGAALYNAGHSLLGPALLALAAHLLGASGTALPLALVWAAHVGFDRLLGYGLKYPAGFAHTHLGLLGRRGA